MNETQKTLSDPSAQALRPDAIIIRTSRGYGLLWLVSGGFAVGLVLGWRYLYPISGPMQWMFLSLSIICALAGTYMLFDKKPRLVLADDGFTDCKCGVGRVSWEEVSSVRISSFNGTRYLYVLFKDAELGRQRIKGIFAIRPTDAQPHEATIFIGGLDISPHELIEMMQQRMARKSGQST